MNNRERLKLIIENWFVEKTSIKPTEEGLNNLVDRIYYDKQLILSGVSHRRELLLFDEYIYSNESQHDRDRGAVVDRYLAKK